MQDLLNRIRSASSLLLTTHREPDGDGLGAQMALYYALNKMGKKVRILNVDRYAKRYAFLDPHKIVQFHNHQHDAIGTTDLALVFDTNDSRYVEPLFSELTKVCGKILFVDHHIALTQGPRPTLGSFINLEAASTGEIVFDIIKGLKVELDSEISLGIYTSIVFDTQLFRHIRQSPRSHIIAAELLKYVPNTDTIHRSLFSYHTPQKISFLARTLANVEYHCDGAAAFVLVDDQELEAFGLDLEASRDVIDMIMDVESVRVAVLIRKDENSHFKISLRSKDGLTIVSAAEALGGGGHIHSAGAFVKGNYQQLKVQILTLVSGLLQKKTG